MCRLVYTFIMILGGLYYKHEERISSFMKFALIPLLIVYVGIIAYTWTSHSIACLGLSGKCNVLGFISSVCGTLLLVELVKRIRLSKLFNFIGKNSIVFYFLSGVMPAGFGLMLKQLNCELNYIFTLKTALLSISVSYGVTWCKVRFAPWLTDFRKLKP